MSDQQEECAPSSSGSGVQPEPEPGQQAEGRPKKLTRGFHSLSIQPTRVKRVMQSEPVCGRMKDTVPAAVAVAMEKFAGDFLKRSAQIALDAGGKTLGSRHMAAAVSSTPEYAFLLPLFGGEQPQSSSSSSGFSAQASSTAASAAIADYVPRAVDLSLQQSPAVGLAPPSVAAGCDGAPAVKRKRGRPPKNRERPAAEAGANCLGERDLNGCNAAT